MPWTPRKIVELRASRGWTQTDLANEISASRRVVQIWEAGDDDEPSKMSKSNARALDRLAAERDRRPVAISDLVANVARIPTRVLFTEAVRRLMTGVSDVPQVPQGLAPGSSREPLQLTDEAFNAATGGDETPDEDVTDGSRTAT